MQNLEELSIEEAFKILDELASELENGELPLEESFNKYEEGMKILKAVSNKIEEVENKIKKINENGTVSEL